MPRSSGPQRGFSILEVVISIAVLSIALLGTSAAVHYGMKSQTHGKLVSEAQSYADRIMTIMLERNLAHSQTTLAALTGIGLNDSSGARVALNASPLNSITDGLPSDTRYLRNISVRECRLPTETDGKYAWKDGLRQVTVTVYWKESGHDALHPREGSVTLQCISKLPH